MSCDDPVGGKLLPDSVSLEPLSGIRSPPTSLRMEAIHEELILVIAIQRIKLLLHVV